MKKALTLLLSLAMLFSLAACGQSGGDSTDDAPSTLVYGSADYTRIDPAMDEHCEINLLLFNGLTAHDGNDQIVPALAERWDYDEANCTYTFYLREDVKWHDGEPFMAQDVKFTIEAIMDPDNASENAPNYEDVQEITVLDDHTVSFRLAEPNAAFLEYMTMAILPQHLLEGEDMQESAFFRAPVGTGPYKLESWDAGQSIVLVRNEDYFLGAPNIERVIFKIVPDDNAQAMQLESGEIDLALLDPKNAQNFAGKDGYTCYDMTTADYRGILFNFNNPYWTENRDIIPAVCYAIDRQAIVDSVLLGQGMAAYSPLQRNVYNDETVNHYDYDPTKAKEILESVGCTMGESGYYERNGEEIGFVISVMSGEQDRIDIAQAAAQQLREVGIHCTVDIPAQMDWSGQMACLIGWGSPFDADDHTYHDEGPDVSRPGSLLGRAVPRIPVRHGHDGARHLFDDLVRRAAVAVHRRRLDPHFDAARDSIRRSQRACAQMARHDADAFDRNSPQRAEPAARHFLAGDHRHAERVEHCARHRPHELDEHRQGRAHRGQAAARERVCHRGQVHGRQLFPHSAVSPCAEFLLVHPLHGGDECAQRHHRRIDAQLHGPWPAHRGRDLGQHALARGKGADDRRVVDLAHPGRIFSRDAPLHHEPWRLPAQPHEQKRKQPINRKKGTAVWLCLLSIYGVYFAFRMSMNSSPVIVSFS